MAKRTAPRGEWPESRGSSEPQLDLHGQTVADALRQANNFLIRERQRGTVSVRIVTGHGTGALKSAIRQMLGTHPAVASSRVSLTTDAVMLVLLNPPARR